MESSFGRNCCAFLDGNACVNVILPSPLRTRYSMAPSTMDIPLRQSSTLMSCWMICWACIARDLPLLMQLNSNIYYTLRPYH